MLEILIKERYYKRENKIFQHFIFDKKYNKYLTNERLKISQEFERKIKEKKLDYYFIKRRDEKDRFVLEYEGDEKPQNNYFVVAAELPKNLGCDYCIYKKERKTNFLWCEYKQEFTSKIKTCKFFRQK
jgi:hypothetical protein